MSFQEAPSNWLSKLIEEKRSSIDRLLPVFERRAEQKAIVAAIKSHPKGEQLAMNSNLDDVVFAAIGVANAREREARNQPNVRTASPAIQASWFVFDELGLPHPEPE